MKKLSLVLAAVMIALLAAVPASATGTSAFAPGELSIARISAVFRTQMTLLSSNLRLIIALLPLIHQLLITKSQKRISAKQQSIM